MKVPVFEQGSLEAALYWRKQFEDLIKLKNLDVAAKFMKANILTSGAGREKWQQARAEVLGNPPANETGATFNRTMLTFIQKCGATSKTAEDLRDFIMNAKKPPNLRFEDFKQQDLKNSMITYLTFQDLSIKIWEMINFL
jgi:hypothetical protein